MKLMVVAVAICTPGSPQDVDTSNHVVGFNGRAIPASAACLGTDQTGKPVDVCSPVTTLPDLKAAVRGRHYLLTTAASPNNCVTGGTAKAVCVTTDGSNWNAVLIGDQHGRLAVAVNLPPEAPTGSLGAAGCLYLPGTRADVRCWGATGNGVTDDTAAIQNAINSVASTGGEVFFPVPPVSYLITRLVVSSNGTHLAGAGGQRSVLLTCAPPAAGSCIKFSAATKVIYNISIRNLAINGNNAVAKNAIEIDDASQCIIDQVTVGVSRSFTGAGSSTGLLLRGREFIHVVNSQFNADNPIHIASDPNRPLIALDSSDFQDDYILGPVKTATLPLIRVDNDPNLAFQNVNFVRGGWVGGCGGFVWNDSTSGQQSINMTFRDFRWEQTSSCTNAYGISINKTGSSASLQNGIIENFSTIVAYGIYLRKVNNFSVVNFYFGSREGVAFDAASNTVRNLRLQNVFSNSPAVDVTGAMNVTGNWMAADKAFTK